MRITFTLLAIPAVACGGSQITNGVSKSDAGGPEGFDAGDAHAERCPTGVCPITLASGQDRPEGIAVDDANVYWATAGGCDRSGCSGTVMKVSRNGGAPVPLASGQDEPYAIAVDGTSVYWTNLGNSNLGINNGSVMMAPLDGGTITMLAAGQSTPSDLKLDATNAYWTNSNSNDGRVMRVPLKGGSPSELARDTIGPSVIAVDSAAVYWGNIFDVMRVPLDGGAPAVFVEDAGAPRGMAIDATRLYWTANRDGTIMSASLSGGAIAQVASDPSPSATRLLTVVTVDSSSVYWASWIHVMKVPLDGEAPVLLAPAGLVNGIAIDATSVYWTEEATGVVMMLTPK